MARPTILSFFDEHGWIEAPQVPHREWQVAVANGDTEEGYFEFVATQLKAAGRPFEFEDANLELEIMEVDPVVSKEISDRFPKDWWKNEVAALDTRRGYAKWAAAQQQALEEEEALIEQADAGLALSTPRSQRSFP